MRDRSDEELMEAYCAGQSAAFDELYSRYSGRVYAYLIKRVFDSNERDDLFQAIFLKLHRSRTLYNRSFLFAPWLFTISRTMLLDHLKQKKPMTVPLEEQAISETQSDAKFSFSKAVADLPERQRTAIELRYKEGLDFKEIADRLSLSHANVRQLVSRAVRKIRKRI